MKGFLNMVEVFLKTLGGKDIFRKLKHFINEGFSRFMDFLFSGGKFDKSFILLIGTIKSVAELTLQFIP